MRRLCALWMVLGTAGLCRAAGIEAITRPSDDRTLSFVRSGKIAQVYVKDGDTVKAGQLLVQLDDAVERAQLGQLHAQAQDQTRVKAAQAQLAQKKEDLEKLKAAEVKKWDIAHARLDVVIAELSLQLARFEHEQSRRKYEEARLQLERMRLRCPLAGRVMEVFLRPGESADALQPVLRLVKIDPLRADVPVPRGLALKLRVGGSARIAFQAGDPPAHGRITYIAPEGDAASDTVSVRVEFPNPKGRPAGEHVWVTFPPARQPAAAGTGSVKE